MNTFLLLPPPKGDRQAQSDKNPPPNPLQRGTGSFNQFAFSGADSPEADIRDYSNFGGSRKKMYSTTPYPYIPT